MSYNNNQEEGNIPTQVDEYGNHMLVNSLPNEFHTSASASAPTDGTSAVAGNSFSGWASNSGTGNVPAHQNIQDQQQKLIADNILNAVMGNGSNVISIPALIARLQSMLPPAVQQPSNKDVLKQQLQQLIQNNQPAISAPLGSNNETVTAAAATHFNPQGIPQEHPEDRKPAAATQISSHPVSMQTGSDDNETPPPVIVPCRARGMASHHNATTGYFSIPHDIQHGGNLFCSHQGCRDDGVKFCYCSHCGIPVAKRNFRQRHDHTGEMKKKMKRGASADIQSFGLQQPRPALSWKEGLESSSDVQDNRNQRAPMRSLSFQTKRENVTNSSGSEVQVEAKNVSCESDEFDGFQIDKDTQNIWTSLLFRRPRGDVSGDDMSRWLLSVLEVSNSEDTARKILSTKGALTRDALASKGRNGKADATAEFGLSRNGCSEPSEESTFGGSEGASSESSDQERESSSDSNEYNKFVDKSRLIQSGVMKPESGLARPFGESTESSGPTDQSAGLSTSASNPTTSGSGSNTTGGSSSDSENGFNDILRGSIPKDRKRASASDDPTTSGSGSNITGGSSSDSENGFNDNLRSIPKDLKRASSNDDPTSSGSGTNSTGGSSTDSDNGSSNGRDGPTASHIKRASANSELNVENHQPPIKKRKL